MVNNTNIDALILNLNRYAENDVRYQQAILQLEVRVQEALCVRLHTTLYEDQIPEGPEDSEIVPGESPYLVRLLLAYLIVFQNKKRTKLYFLAQCALIAELVPQQKARTRELTDLLLNCITSEAPMFFRYDWFYLKNYIPSNLIDALLKAAENYKFLPATIKWERYGILQAQNGVISLFAENLFGKTKHPVISVLQNRLQLVLSEPLQLAGKQMQSLDAILRMTARTIRDLRTYPSTEGKMWRVGDSCVASVVGKEGERVCLRTTGKQGKLPLEGLLVFNSTSNPYSNLFSAKRITDSLQMDHVINVRVCSIDPVRFDVYDSLRDYYIHDKSEGVAAEKKAELLAIAAEVAEDGIITWIDSKGRVLQSDYDNQIEVEPGSICRIQYIGVEEENAWAIIKRETNEPFQLENALSSLMGNYVFCPSPENNQLVIEDLQIKELVRVLLILHNEARNRAERYNLLTMARLLSVFIGQSRDADYVKLLQQYLNTLERFHEEKPIEPLQRGETLYSSPQISLRCEIVEILCAMDGDASIPESGQLQITRDLTRLATAYRCLRNDGDKEILEQIRRKVSGLLALAAQPDTILSPSIGYNYGEENEYQEFKTSFKYPPIDQKHPQYIEIARGICAFLNTKHGGTIYIGVNNAGYINGLDDEIKEEGDIDGYIESIKYKLRPLFPGFSEFVSFRPEQDNRVLAIVIKPYIYGIATVNEKPYIRWSQGKKEMTEMEKREVLNSRLCIDNHFVDCYLKLQEARENHLQVILHNYSSNNSQSHKDRVVEPFGFSFHHGGVYGYEISSGGEPTGMVKQYRIPRIEKVEILPNAEWHAGYEADHKKLNVDIFRMAGLEKEHIQIWLNQRAYNLIREEFPDSKEEHRLLTNVGNDDYPWILSTDIYSPVGAGRFIAGLMKDVLIQEGAGLKRYVENYLSAALNAIQG